jgi:hypothetical protein
MCPRCVLNHHFWGLCDITHPFYCLAIKVFSEPKELCVSSLFWLEETRKGISFATGHAEMIGN